MKNLIPFCVLIFAIACAKKNPEHQGSSIKDLIGMKEALIAQARESQSQSQKAVPVKTKNLDLVYPNDKKLGKVMLVNDDAKMLYKSMKIASTNINETEIFSAINVKKGHEISCAEMISIDERRPTVYGCELQIHYADGAVISINENIDVDDTVETLKTDFEGLNIDLDSSNKKSVLTLKQNTALVLYMIMNVVENDASEKTLVKNGQGYSCTKFKSEDADDVYTCTFKIDHINGKVKTQI